MTAPDVPSRPSEANLLHKYVHDRITNLLAARQLFRKGSAARFECRLEIHALLTLARAARRQAEEAAADGAVWRVGVVGVGGSGGTVTVEPEQADPLTSAKSFHDWQAAAPDPDKVWTEAEMNYAAGR